MSPDRLRLCRSALFLPASNPRAVEKAFSLPADLIILDCEDAVRPEDKGPARDAAVEALAKGFEGRICAIRINAVGTAWHEDDLAAARASKAELIVLPKAEDQDSVRTVREAGGKPVIAMIESARGVLASAAIAGASAALMAGTNDLAADLGLPHSKRRVGLVTALQSIVIAARAAGNAAFDGVFNGLQDLSGLEEESRQGRSFGFDGKSVIHPGQIDIVNLCFSPDEGAVAEAERLIAAASGGAKRFEGRMIEDMHVAQARTILAKAGR